MLNHLHNRTVVNLYVILIGYVESSLEFWKRVFLMTSVFSWQSSVKLYPVILYSKATFSCYFSYLLTFYFWISIMFIYLFLAVLGLRCCMEAFSSCGEQWLLLVAARAPHCGGFSCWARLLYQNLLKSPKGQTPKIFWVNTGRCREGGITEEGKPCVSSHIPCPGPLFHWLLLSYFLL